MFESYEEDYAAAAQKIGRHISEIGQNEGNFGRSHRKEHSGTPNNWSSLTGAQKGAIKSANAQIKEAEIFVRNRCPLQFR
jgi:hypothetical protein